MSASAACPVARDLWGEHVKNRLVRLAAAGAAGLALVATAGPSSAQVSSPTAAVVHHAHVMALVGDTARDHEIGVLDGTGLPEPGPLFNLSHGPILQSPRVYLVFWGWNNQDPDGARAKMIDLFTNVGGSAWAGVTTQYNGVVNGQTVNITNPVGQLAGTWDDNTTGIHDNLTDLELAQEAGRAVAHFNGGTPDPNANYFIATPKTANATTFNRQQYCAWHDWTDTRAYPGVTPGISFTNMPYVLNMGGSCGQDFVNPGAAGTLDGVTIVAGHEYLEAVTDPALNAWQDATFDENADKCAWVVVGPGKVSNVTVSPGHTYALQGTWSNAALNGAGACATS